MNPDYKEMLQLLNEEGARFLLVGAYALATHGHVRATGDIDLWVEPTQDNAAKVWRALARFGAPLHQLAQRDLMSPDLIFQIGVAPLRIDILTSIDGDFDFQQAWQDKHLVDFDGVSVPVLNAQLLLINKRASGRPKDMGDVQWLESYLND